jgi:hypothetical protein
MKNKKICLILISSVFFMVLSACGEIFDKDESNAQLGAKKKDSSEPQSDIRGSSVPGKPIKKVMLDKPKKIVKVEVPKNDRSKPEEKSVVFSELNYECAIAPYPDEDEEDYYEKKKLWQKHTASKDLECPYGGSIVKIAKGRNFYTYLGKIAIGWHGTFDPPSGM